MIPLTYKKFEFDYPKPFLMSGELEILTNHFERLEEGQDKMAAQIDMMEDNLKQLKGAIIGDPPVGMKGLAARMEDMEDRITEYDRRGIMASTDRVSAIEEKLRGYDKLLDRGWGASKAIIGVWTLVGGFLGYIITLILKKFGI